MFEIRNKKLRILIFIVQGALAYLIIEYVLSKYPFW